MIINKYSRTTAHQGLLCQAASCIKLQLFVVCSLIINSLGGGGLFFFLDSLHRSLVPYPHCSLDIYISSN